MSADNRYSNRRSYTDYSRYNYCCDDRLWFVVDCPGMCCSAFTWLLIIYAEFVVIYVILWPHKNLLYQISNGIAYNMLALLAICSYLRAMLTDPGAVPIDDGDQSSSSSTSVVAKVRCRKCGCKKPARAHHCSVCRRCIRKMDHHCPWINNCVGEDNRKYFVLFNFYTALLCIYTGALTFIKFMKEMETDWRETTPFNGSITLLLLSVVALEAFVFGTFTTIIGGVQMHEILQDRTYIEKIKHEDDGYGAERSRMENCRAVFGENCCCWLSPCSGGSDESSCCVTNV